MLHDELLLLRRALRAGQLLALSYCAIVGSANGSTVRVAPVSSSPGPCVVHIATEKEGERTVACSQPTTIDGHATAWLEQESTITPYLTDVTAGGTFRVGGLVPKGAFRIPLDAGERIRVISLATPRDFDSLRFVFVREVPAGSGAISVPAGRVLILRMNAKGKARGYSEIVVNSGHEQGATWSVPIRAAALVAVLHKAKETASVTAIDAAGAHAPSSLVEGADTIVAFWREVTGPVRISASGENTYLPEEGAPAAAGEIAVVEGSLRPLPTLSVTIATLAAGVRAGDMTLTVSPMGNDSKVIRRLAVRPGGTYAVEALPAALLTVDLQIGEFVLEKTVDLTHGDDTNLLISPEPLTVSGVVYRGNSPTHGQVRFLQKKTPVTGVTDDSGAYEVTLWQARRYIVEAVAGDDGAAPPFSQDVAIGASRHLDIHIPANSLSVRIVEAESGKPVETARIAIHNVWEGGSRAAVIPATGEWTHLPPQKNGRTEIRVHAEGFVDPEAVIVPVDDALGEKTVEFVLERDRNVVRVTVRLPSGAPAAGAELGSFSGDEMTWHGVADDTGQIGVPKTAAGQAIIVRHSEAASVAVILGADNASNVVDLSAPAPPLIVRVVGRDGEPAMRASARVTLTRRGGRRLSGQRAAFATWSLGATTPDGLFVAKGLPQEPVHIVATAHATSAQIDAGTFDTLATTIPYPWPPINTITLADQ